VTRNLAAAIEKACALAMKAWGGENWTQGVATMVDAVCGHEEEDLSMGLDGFNESLARTDKAREEKARLGKD
jgi:hypothetical protein